MIDVFKGKAGLAKTFWLWGIAGGVFFTAGFYGLNYLYVRNLDNSALTNITTYIYPALLVLWGTFISIATINAAGYNRKRKFWGWVATVVGGLSLIKTAMSALVILGLMPMTWSTLSKSIRAENLALPAQIGEELTLHEMRLNQADKSLTYFIHIDTPTLSNNAMDTDIAKSAILDGCMDLEPMFKGPVEKITYRYEANDKTLSLIDVLPKDCGL